MIDWGGHVYDVHNAYKEIADRPTAAREEAIGRWLAMSSPQATAARDAEVAEARDWTKARALVRPLLQQTVVVDDRRLVSSAFSSDLRIAYALDLGSSMAFVAEHDFAPWRIGLEQLHRAALANLDRDTADVPIAVETEHDKPILAMVFNADSYDSSRILLPSIRERLIGILGTPVLAAIPAREAFYAWSPHSTACAENIDRVHASLDKLPHPLSDEIFVLSDDGVRPARPEELGL